MTLGYFCKLLVRKWYVFILLPLALCAGTAFVLEQLPSEYQAKALLVVSDGITTSNKVAKTAIDKTAKSYPDVKLSRTTSIADKKTAINATGESPETCIEAANAAAEKATSMLAEKAPNITVDLKPAKKATDISRRTELGLYVTLALVVGLVLSLSIAIVWTNLKNAKQREGEGLQ